ncbi:MAG: alpha/beta hydrolase [Clostridiales bacterium]|nr:alpha/beta hydrolase [Clostridiales bacterium]
MTIGFSYIGLIWLIMLFVPNFIWTKNKPKDYDEYAKKENKVLLVFERVGQFIVTPAALIFSNFNIHKITFWSVVLLISFICMVIYEIFWIRYFKSEKTMKDFYRNMFGFKVPGASLPVAAFFLLGIYGGNIIMIAGAIILGIGHIGIHLQHRKEAWGAKPKKKLPVRIILGFIKVVGILIQVAIAGIFIILIAGRNTREIQRFVMFKDGVNDCLYVPLKYGEGYVRITGKNENNPVIVSLHGGPGEPTGYSEYAYNDLFTDEYTVVCWDQSGCGRSYYRELEKGDRTVYTMEAQVEDLDALVDYLRDRFNQNKVIILGHSYGTILGAMYSQAHPEKVTAYIGIGQVVSFKDLESEHYSYRDALAQAKAKGDDTTELERVYKEFCDDPTVVNMQPLRQATSVYHQETVPEAIPFSEVLISPYVGVDDVRWIILEFSMFIGNMEYEAIEGDLINQLYQFDIRERYTNYEVPVLFISGSADWTCPCGMVKEYYDTIEAPKKSMYVMEGCGHGPQSQLPEDFVSAVKQFVKSA